jgi:hypothetical protein
LWFEMEEVFYLSVPSVLPIVVGETTVVRIAIKNKVIVQWCDVYIGRACGRGGWNLSQSKWHNPYTVSKHGDKCLLLYVSYLYTTGLVHQVKRELQGKVLGCWCKPGRCHGDVLKYIADYDGIPTAEEVVKKGL